MSKVAIVTGAAGGLGGAVARLLASDGIRVALVDVDVDGLTRVSAGLPDSSVHATDLGQPNAADQVVRDVLGLHGRVDILVNAAAILARRSLADATPDHFDRVFAVNARAAFFLCRAVLPDMSTRGWGRIVNVTSTGVYQGGETMTSAAYEASKGAVAVLTKQFAKEGARQGILVNTLCPGGMRTQMLLRETPASVITGVEARIPLGRLAEPVEVARMIQWLVSDLNTYATGATFDVNGGLVMYG